MRYKQIEIVQINSGELFMKTSTNVIIFICAAHLFLSGIIGCQNEETSVGPPKDMKLIPAGEFLIGSHEGDDIEKPVHSVYVDAFYMDKYEVTNEQYAEFLNAKRKHVDAGKTWYRIGEEDARIEYVNRVYRVKVGYKNHPVVEVSWYGAMAYAKWKGKRLPTEAEWEKASRGNLVGIKYPWGNSIDSTQANYNQNIGDTTTVGKYQVNGYGLYDMAGNVWEWCLDEYNESFYAISPRHNPIAGASGIERVVKHFTRVNTPRVMRGGSWLPSERFLRVAQRYYDAPSRANDNLGFRCASTVTP